MTKKLVLTIRLDLLNQHVKVGKDVNVEVTKHILDYIFIQLENCAGVIREFSIVEENE